MQNVPSQGALFSSICLVTHEWVLCNNGSSWKAPKLPAPWKYQQGPLSLHQHTCYNTGIKHSSNAFMGKSHIGLQLGSSPSWTSMSFFSSRSAGDPISESWLIAIANAFVTIIHMIIDTRFWYIQCFFLHYCFNMMIYIDWFKIIK